MMPAEERYLRDAAFKALVDLIEKWIMDHQYTPTEIREAAMLAAIRYEYQCVRPRFIFKQEDGSIDTTILHGEKS